MALPVTITGLSTAVAPVGPFKVGGTYPGAAVADTSGIAVSASGVINGGTGAGIATGQSFTNGSSATTITSVVVYLFKAGTPTDNLWVEISQTDPSGALLATSNTVAGSAVTATTLAGANAVTFTFPTPPAVAGSATFGVRVFRVGSDGVNYYQIPANTANAYAGGSSWLMNSVGWSASSGVDLRMTVNGSVTIADAYYFFGRDGTTATTLTAFKATDPASTWSTFRTRTGFTTAILGLAGYQVGSTIHLAITDGTSPTLLATKYVSYDTLTDTFLATTETIAAASSQIAAAASPSIVVRSTGEVVAFFNGVGTKTSGTTYSRVYYSRRTAVNTWAAAVEVDPSTAVNSSNPVAVLGQSDRVHFAHVLGANTGYRTLSAANALNTSASNATMGVPGDGCGYDRAGTFKVVFTGAGSNQITMRFNSADNPTPTFVSQSIANARDPHRIGSDNFDNSVTIVYSNSADTDLYAIKSTDDGATFGTPVNIFAGTVGGTDLTLSRSSSGSMYDRGASFVVGYIVNDNGTWKYNEYFIRASAVTGTGVLASGVSAVAGSGAVTGYYGTGALAAGASTLAGVAVVTARGTGALSAAISAAAGSGVSSSNGTSVLTVAAATAAGSGTVADVPHGTFIDHGSALFTFSNGNLTATKTGGSGSYASVLSQTTRGATKVYAELSLDVMGSTIGWRIGPALNSVAVDGVSIGQTNESYGWIIGLGYVYHNGTQVGSADSLTGSGSRLFGIAVDRIAHTLQYRDIGADHAWSAPVTISDIDGSDLALAVQCYNVGDQFTFNFDGVFAGAPPAAGYTRWDGSPFTPFVATGTGALVAGSASHTNYLQQSQNLEAWSKLASTVSVDAAVAPDGSTTAEIVTDDATTNFHGVGIGPVSTPTVLSTYTYSIHVKAGTLPWVQLMCFGAANANFGLASGTKGLSSGGILATNISDAGNGWWRCSMTFASASAPALYVFALPVDQADYNYTGTGSGTILAWGGQVELGVAPSAYIPTTATAVTVFDPVLTGVGAAATASGTIIYYYDPARVTRSNGNITVVNNATDNAASTVISQSTRGATKVYAELSIDANARNFMFKGIGLTTEPLDQYLGISPTSYGWVAGSVTHNDVNVATGMPTASSGHTVAVAVDRIAHTLQVRNITTSSAWSAPVDISDIAANDLCFAATFDRVNDQYTFNFDGAFAGVPPALGYTRWDGTAFSYSLPSVTGTGALASAASTLSGAGTVTTSGYVGTGALQAAASPLSSVGRISKAFLDASKAGTAIVLSNNNLTATMHVVATWSPADLGAALVAWYKADAGVYKDAGVTPAANGDPVNQWSDQSGNSNHLTATGAYKPTLNATGLNGRPALIMSNTTPTGMTGPWDATVLPSASPASCFAVAQMLSPSHDIANLFGFVGNGEISYQWVYFSSGGAAFWCRNGAGSSSIQAYRAGSSGSYTSMALATSYRLGGVFSGSGHTMYLNNVVQVSSGIGGSFSSPGTIIFGCGRAEPAASWDGPVSEIVMTNSVLSVDDRALLDAYFVARWGF